MTCVMLRTSHFRSAWLMSQASRSYTQKNSETELNIKGRMEKIRRVKPLGQSAKIWEIIEKKTKSGQSLTFKIQEIPEDRYEDALRHMCTYFLADEPTCRCHKSKNDPAFVNDISAIWRRLFAEGISVGAFVDNPDGGKPIIAGMNALGISFKDHDSFSDIQFASRNWKNTFQMMSNETKVAFDHYGVNQYLGGVGLSVAPEYRGYGLGVHILKSRDYISREYKIPATITVFTSIFSQKSAMKAGYELVTQKDFVNVLDENGKECFPGIESKTMKIMGKRFF